MVIKLDDKTDPTQAGLNWTPATKAEIDRMLGKTSSELRDENRDEATERDKKRSRTTQSKHVSARHRMPQDA